MIVRPWNSIQFKIVLGLFLFAGTNLLINLFSFRGLESYVADTDDLIGAQYGGNYSSQQTILALEETRVVVDAIYNLKDPKGIDTLRASEAKFLKNSLHFEMFINMLIWGSESEAFRLASGGALIEEWNHLEISKKIETSPLEDTPAQTAGQADLYYGAYASKVLRLVALKKAMLGGSRQLTSQSQMEIVNIYNDILDKQKAVLGQLTDLSEQIRDSSRTKLNGQADKSKALLLNSILLSVGGFLTVFVLGLYVTYKILVKPIKILSRSVSSISDGNFDTKVPVIGKDEIGELGNEFNIMGEKLKEMYGTLEERVEQRTKELKEKVSELGGSKKAIMNLLEDATDLEEQLKLEKAGIEKKVEDRTKELATEKSKIDGSIESLPVGYIMTDLEGGVVHINTLTKKILSVKEEGEEEKLQTILGLRENVQKVIKDQVAIVLPEINFEGRILFGMVSPIFVGDKKEVIGTVVIIEDVTERKVLERSKDEFFSIASHELRTPLTAIRGNTEMILDNYADKIKDKDVNEMLADIHEGSVRLIEIVNDFLNVSRLEMHKLEFKIEKQDICEVIKKTIKEFQVTGSRQKLDLIFEKPDEVAPMVMVDVDRVKQVLINLIGNGFKFTKEGGVSISAERVGTNIEVSVKDTGEGLTPEQQNLLFHKFQQAGTSLYTRDTSKGTGLGLYISRLLIEGMGGKIWLKSSEPGKGSIFTFSLPSA